MKRPSNLGQDDRTTCMNIILVWHHNYKKWAAISTKSERNTDTAEMWAKPI
jgi:hypothetical protein